MTFPGNANVSANPHGIDPADRRPDRGAAGQPQRVADFFADQTHQTHPDLDSGQTLLVPTRLSRPVVTTKVHEVSLEVRTAPFAPRFEDRSQVLLCAGMRDVED